MKAKYILSSLLLASCTFFSSCVDNLDISQHGVSTFESFYKTDADAEEAIIACYSNWKDTYAPAFWLKNLLSDDCYSAGESWTACFQSVVLVSASISRTRAFWGFSSCDATN